MRLGAFLLGVALVGPAWPQSGAGSEKEWRIEGQVVDSVTGAPIRKVLVRLSLADPGANRSSRQRESLGILTDAEGRFTFTGTEPATATLVLEHPDYRSRFIPEQGTNEQPITVGPGENRTGLVLKMTPFAVITGRVVDQDGDPAPNVHVEILGFDYTMRGRELGRRGGSMTDDQGQYRIAEVPPGRYYFRATPRRSGTGRESVRLLNSPGSDLPTYYPSGADHQAALPLQVAPAQRLEGVDITLRRGPEVTVSGRVVGAPADSGYLVFLSSRSQGFGGTSRHFTSAMDGEKGRFALHNVPPGEYTIRVEIHRNGARLTARVPVEVNDQNLEGIELRPAPAFDVRGKLQFEGPQPFPSQPAVINTRNDDEVSGSASAAQGSPDFVVRGVIPGSHFVDVFSPPGAYVKSVRLGDSDYLDQPIDLTAGPPAEPLVVTLSTNVAKIEGTVDLAGKPLPSAAMAVLLPASANSRRMQILSRQTAIQPDGRYNIPNVAPGTYRVYAWTYGNITAALFDPDYLKPYLSYGADVTVGEGGLASVTVKLIPRIEEE